MAASSRSSPDDRVRLMTAFGSRRKRGGSTFRNNVTTSGARWRYGRAAGEDRTRAAARRGLPHRRVGGFAGAPVIGWERGRVGLRGRGRRSRCRRRCPEGPSRGLVPPAVPAAGSGGGDVAGG